MWKLKQSFGVTTVNVKNSMVYFSYIQQCVNECIFLKNEENWHIENYIGTGSVGGFYLENVYITKDIYKEKRFCRLVMGKSIFNLFAGKSVLTIFLCKIKNERF